MSIPCEVVVLLTEFLCRAISGRDTPRGVTELAVRARDFLQSQMPALVSLHVIDRVDEARVLAASERIAKGFASVILTEEGG